MRKETTASHTVPACYLANFGSDGNKGRKTTVYFLNTKNGTKGVQNLERFPVVNSFYDSSILGLNSQALENFYMEIEGEFAALLRNALAAIRIDPSVREDRVVCLPNDDKAKLSAMLAFQITRTNAFREKYAGAYKQLEDGLKGINLPKYNKDDFKRIHLTELLENRMSNFFANLFDDRNWIILINHTEVPFYTSDNPVVAIDNRKSREQGFSILSKETTFYFPISPQVAVELYHKDVAKNDLMYFDIYKAQNVMHYNAEVQSQCSIFVLANQPIDSMLNEAGDGND